MSTPDAQDKKFHNSRLSPCGQQPPRRRAAVQITPAPQSPPLPPKRLATPAIAGKLMAWTAPPAPARWKPRSVRCPGSVRSRCCSPQKSCWLTPRAMSALRLRTRSARRGIRCAMPMLPQQSKPEVAAARQSAVTDAGYHDGLELGAGAGQPPCRSVGLYCHHPGWPVAGCPPGATPDQERELVRH